MKIIVAFMLYYVQATVLGVKRNTVWNGIRIRGNDTSGRILVKVNGRWGYICDPYWTKSDADVACRQMEFDGAVVASKFITHRVNFTVTTLYNNITCNGTENSLEQCNGNFGNISRCPLENLVQVKCIQPSPSNNTVTKCKRGQFLCKQKNMCIPERWKCDTVDDCGDNSDEINCLPAIRLPLSAQPFRLVGGAGPYEGRLEVKYAGIWGTVCDDGFTTTTGNVLCRQLGYSGVLRLSRFGRGTGQIWLDEIRCMGNETSILHCLRKPFGAHDCDHREDIGVVCKQKNLNVLNKTIIANTTSSKQKACGTQIFPVRGLRIVGGQVANKGSWPWMATINVLLPFGGSEHICGGTLIAKQWILTSAHCFDKTRNPKRYEVRLGDYNLNVKEKSEQTFSITKIILHSQYVSGNHANDIALVKLNRTANTTSNYINTACIPNIDTNTETGFCYATGWGDTKDTGDRRILHQVKVPLYPYKQCREQYGSKVTNDMVCAGYEYGGKDACKGDSGGPLMCKQNNRWIVVGVVTWGQGCAEPHHPGVYMNVKHYLYWIKQTFSLAQSPLLSNPFGSGSFVG